jgi:hypothetical protein
MILKNTPIPGCIVDLHKQFGVFWIKVEALYSEYDDKSSYIRGHAPVPAELTERISDSEKSIDETVKKIDSLVDRLTELCKEMQ